MSEFLMQGLLLLTTGLSAIFTALIFFRIRERSSVQIEAFSDLSPLPGSVGVSLRIENRTARTVIVESIAVGGSASILTDDRGLLMGTGAGAARLGSAVRSQWVTQYRRLPAGSQMILIPLVVECSNEPPTFSVGLLINRRIRPRVTKRARVLIAKSE